MPIFTSKGVPDPLIQASSNILNSVPKYAPGDNVVVKEGPNAGMDGRVVGSRSAGYTDIQLTRGRQITISDDSISPPSGLLNEAHKNNDDEEEDDNNGKPLDFKGKKKKKKSKKDFFKKKDDDDDEDSADDDDDDDDKNEKDDDGPEEEDGLPKKAKKKSKAGGKGEEIEINPKLGEQIQDLNRKANIIQSGRAMSIMRGFLTNK